MRKSLLLLVTLLIYGSLLLILPDAAVAQGWEGSGPVSVGTATCTSSSQCASGQYCFNFRCESCPGPGPGVCKQWVSGGGCSIVNQPDGTPCDGAGYFCNAGACVNCQNPGGPCTPSCCSGSLCDGSQSKCVQCDAITHVQTNPAVSDGGGKCEASCGASSQCDEQPIGAFVASGICNSTCQYVDGDASQAACDSAVGPVPGSWNLGAGSEVAATTCCGDDSGENNRFRDCAPGVCTDNPADKKCCNADADCVFSGQCYYDANAAITSYTLWLATNTCNRPTQSSCESVKQGNANPCLWIGGACVPRTVTRADLQAAQKAGSFDFPAYADVNGDGAQEVCLAASPGQWRGTAGSIAGRVSNISTGDQCAVQCPAPCIQGCPVSGALVRILGINPPLTATTASDGTYTIGNVPTGNRDVTASKTGYEAKTNYAVPVYDGGVTTSDFVLVKALGDCEDDCTKVGSNLCDATCHGKGLCWFDSDATKQACDGTFGLTQMPGGTQYVDCCMGRPYTPIKAEASVPAKNVVITKRPVLYKGKFVNMVIVVFNR